MAWKDRTPIEKTGIVIGIAGLAYLTYRGIKAMSGSNVQQAPVDYGQIPVLPGGVLWNPDPLAKEVYENIEGYNLNTYPETAQKILDLQNDEQVKLLYNHYNQYYASDYPTITQLFDAEWDTWDGDYQKVVGRFRSLGLNEGWLSGCGLSVGPTGNFYRCNCAHGQVMCSGGESCAMCCRKDALRNMRTAGLGASGDFYQCNCAHGTVMCTGGESCQMCCRKDAMRQGRTAGIYGGSGFHRPPYGRSKRALRR